MIKKTNDDMVIFSRGKKTFLRPLEEGDVVRLNRWINDPEIRCFLSGSTLRNLEDTSKFVSEACGGNSFSFTICELETGVHIGNMGLHNICYKNGTATTGALIGPKKFRSGGYGTDAKMQVLVHAFFDLNLRKIKSKVLAINLRSRKYLEKTGYVQEGRKVEEVYRSGEYVDLFIMAVFKENFSRIKQKYDTDE